ncbi:inorganic phosphate transporter [Natrinema caseinilyticum]|uniref:inorganic phosphate transporter n=1 Tax=Natrinema caseinilyticum TaxID=2961570 RepID=UPI0020C537DA|nr:inorganic phosphate transporter [Natrinema caseinilyticum]
MIGLNTLATLVVAAGASLFMAWTIGAGSSGSTPFAPAVGANAISVMRAGFVVGLLGFAGAVFQGANVSATIGKSLVDGVILSPIAVVVALFTAAALVALGVYTGYPIATAFTVTGAVVGVGIARGGNPAWATYRQIVGLWVAVPFVGSFLAYTTASLLRDERVSERIAVPVLAGIVGLTLANIEFVFLGSSGESTSLAAVTAPSLASLPLVDVTLAQLAVSLTVAVGCGSVVASDVRSDATAGQRRFLLVLGGLVAFSAGGSQVGLAVGPLLPLRDTVSIPVVWLLVGGGIGLLVGSWTGAPRLIKALARDYSSLGPRRSIAALIPSFLIAQAAILFGIPVSFNEVIVSGIIGSGYAAGGSDVSKQKILYTIAGWVGSLALSLGIGYAVYSVVTGVFLKGGI